jgi:dienelactone hydrolase
MLSSNKSPTTHFERVPHEQPSRLRGHLVQRWALISAYVAGPANADRALVVVQEILGVSSYIRSVCDSLAVRGYRVIAPALFDRVTRNYETGYTAEDARRGMEILRGAG